MSNDESGASTLAGSTALSELRLGVAPLLLYDGQCGVCSSSVLWILSHERKKSLRFLALESDLGRKLRKEAGVADEVDSLLWIEGHQGTLKAKIWSSSVISVLDYVGGPWRLLTVLRWVPGPVRDRAYRLFAKHRLKVASESCLVPTPETRERFLNGDGEKP